MKKSTAQGRIPDPSLERLARLYTILSRLEGMGGVGPLSSRALGELLAVPDHRIRKDLSFLKSSLQRDSPEADFPGADQGYEAAVLRSLIGRGLGLEKIRPLALVGLGRLGCSILRKKKEWTDLRYPITAAFDSSVNRIETIRTEVPLYHSRDIVRVVGEKEILVGILAVPAEVARDVAERLVEGGVRALVNFTPVVIPPARPGITVRNVSLTGELDIISGYLNREGV